MSSPARQELLSSVKNRYLAANRHEKSKILDELCASTGFHRKHAIRALNNFVEKQPYYECRGRKKIYDDPQLILILKKLRVGVGNVCGELFHPEIPTAIKFRNLDLEEVKKTPYWQLQKYPVRINYDSPAHGAGKIKTIAKISCKDKL